MVLLLPMSGIKEFTAGPGDLQLFTVMVPCWASLRVRRFFSLWQAQLLGRWALPTGGGS